MFGVDYNILNIFFIYYSSYVIPQYLLICFLRMVNKAASSPPLKEYVTETINLISKQVC